MPERQTLILAPMLQEAGAVADALKGLPGVTIAIIGIGARRMPTISPGMASRVILVGLAGGLDPDLRTGDVVIDPCPASPPAGSQPGRVHTSGRLLCTPAEKSSTFNATGAACVDMETDVVRRAAHAAGVPLTVVRAILDPADRPLPPYLIKLTNQNGRPRPLALAGLLLRRPSAIRELMRLRREANLALHCLGEAVRHLVINS